MYIDKKTKKIGVYLGLELTTIADTNRAPCHTQLEAWSIRLHVSMATQGAVAKRSRRSGDQDEELVILPKTVRSSQEETTNFREGAVRRIVLHNFL